MPELEELLKRVEELRGRLNELGNKKDLIDPEVIQASKKLDEVLNEYQKLVKEKEKGRS